MRSGLFEGCINLTDIIIGENVTEIRYAAFWDCDSLSSVTIPESVRKLGSNVFCHDNLKNITIYSKDINIVYNSFNCDKLETIYGYKGTNVEKYANENNIEFIPLDENITSDIIRGDFTSASTNFSGDYGFCYSDDYFRGNAIEYNQHLATMSLCLAYSAYNVNSKPYETDQEYLDNNVDDNVKELLKKCGFDKEKSYRYDKKPVIDLVACAIASKEIDGETLIAIAVRGGGYEVEWGSNFTVGENGDHEGFTMAADYVYSSLTDYIITNKINGRIKIWITGFSRAAATSNLLAARLNTSKCINNTIYSKEDIYAYCFATPAGADTLNKNPHSETYNNIYNIIHYHDPVPLVAPDFWNFDRYGKNYIFPFAESTQNINIYEERMELRLNQMGYEYKIKNFDTPDYIIYKNRDSLGRYLRNVVAGLDFGTISTRKLYVKSGKQTDVRMFMGKEDKTVYDLPLTCTLLAPSYFIMHPFLVEIASRNKEILAIAHAEPAYYLAWMQSMDSFYVNGAETYFSKGKGRVIKVNCPVDINVYDSKNKLVAAIINEEPQEIEDSSIIASIDENGQKVIYLPIDDEYTVKTVARENCKTAFAINEYIGVASTISKIISYDEIEMEKNEEIVTLLTKYSNYEEEEESGAKYTLERLDEVIEPNVISEGQQIKDYTYAIETKYDEEQGSIEGGGKFTIGDFCQLTAKSKEGYLFEGWYINEQKVSNEEIYRFAVKENIIVEAKFKEKQNSSLVLGDINQDGYIDTADARMIFQYYVGGIKLTDKQKSLADVNKDGYIDTEDARKILLYCVGKDII